MEVGMAEKDKVEKLLEESFSRICITHSYPKQRVTAEPTRKPLFNFIIENYEQISIEVNGKQKNSVVLKENIDTEILDKMGEVFKTLGYFEMNNIMKGKASEGIGKIKGMLE